jgi:hypothetical protein
MTLILQILFIHLETCNLDNNTDELQFSLTLEIHEPTTQGSKNMACR